MIVDVASAAELQDAGAQAVDRARNDGDRQVDLRLAPGRYDGCPVVLGSDGPPLRTLVMRAADPDDPPRLADLSIRLRAEHVRMEHLVVGPSVRSLPIVALDAGRVEMHGCAMISCLLDAPPGGVLVKLVASGDEPACATIEHCWFVGNRAPGPGCALIGLDGHQRGFANVAFDATVFVANDAEVAILQRAVAVRLTRCLVVAAPDGGAGDVFLALTAPDATAAFEDCLLAWSSAGGLVAPAVGCSGAEVRIRRCVLTGAPDAGTAVELDDVTFTSATHDPLALLGVAMTDAARGRPPDLSRLASALGLDGASLAGVTARTDDH
jgi:hypothetical protein